MRMVSGSTAAVGSTGSDGAASDGMDADGVVSRGSAPPVGAEGPPPGPSDGSVDGVVSAGFVGSVGFASGCFVVTCRFSAMDVPPKPNDSSTSPSACTV